MSSSSRLVDSRGRGAVAPEFLVSPTMLDLVSPSGDRGGMMLGQGTKGEPLSVSVLRPTPTRMVVVGGLYLARQIALRAMATGAWIIIATGRPQAWQPVVRAAGQGPDGRPSQLVQLRRLSPADLPRPTEDMPLLVIHDGGHVPQELFPPRAPWQTTMYVLPYLHPQASSTANNADLVLLQRLPMGQAQLAGQMWRLRPQMFQQLTQLKDDQVIAMGQDMWAHLRLYTTPAEQQILGAVRRGD
ncbi:hypothetical protein ACSHWB_10500 [Lentzea sp. HUAS TT2]|uniref:hypothetical protein n=1 Tax=Lentzea sp. HUAS TT2 TaxID=3447454 RepID=UPI003F6FC551